jgi:hypothetical protein
LDAEGDAADEPAASDEADVRQPPPPQQQAIEELYRQVRTILDMASRVEQQLKTLLDGATGLWPVSSPPSLAAGRNADVSASNGVEAGTERQGDGGNVSEGGRHGTDQPLTADHLSPQATCRGVGPSSTSEQATAGRHWPEAPEAGGTEDAPLTSRRTRGPAKMTPARKAEIEHYMRAGLSLRQAASFVGCHHTTITKAAQRDEEFAEKLQRAEEMGDALPLVRVIRASRQSWRAAAWLVKNHQPCAAMRREKAAERDAEAAESIVRLDRLIRQQAPDVDIKAVLRGGSVSVELRPRGERSTAAHREIGER